MGPLVSTATVAAIGNGAAFRKGREFAAWLGLIPRQQSTGGKARLLGISKRGSIYLRRMFIHGARAVLLRVKYDTGRLGSWAHELELRAVAMDSTRQRGTLAIMVRRGWISAGNVGGFFLLPALGDWQLTLGECVRGVVFQAGQVYWYKIRIARVEFRMTLQIRSIETISGIPVKQVRGFFRHLVSWHRHSFELPHLQEQLSLGKESALALASELQSREYITPPENGIYSLRHKGEELVRASAAGSVSRKTAENALIGLLERVGQYNSDPNKLLTIQTVVVFGSFLGANEKLGDLDIAVKYHHRDPNDPDRAATSLAYAERSGRHFSNIVEWLCWPETELRQIIKARKRTIAIQDWHIFLRMAAADPDHFQYKVVFGSPEDVAGEIHVQLSNNA